MFSEIRRIFTKIKYNYGFLMPNVIIIIIAKCIEDLLSISTLHFLISHKN